MKTLHFLGHVGMVVSVKSVRDKGVVYQIRLSGRL